MRRHHKLLTDGLEACKLGLRSERRWIRDFSVEFRVNPPKRRQARNVYSTALASSFLSAAKERDRLALLLRQSWRHNSGL